MTDPNIPESPKVTPSATTPEADTPEPGTKKKGLKGKLQKLSVVAVILKRMKVFLEFHGLSIIRELFSADKPTRRMTIFFILSLTGFLILMSSVLFNCGSAGLVKVWGKLQEVAREQKELVYRQRKKRDDEASWIKLRKFNFDLKPSFGDRKGASHLAEFDLSVQADSPDTRDYIEENMAQTRNAVFRPLVGLDRETLMSVEGKTKLRQNIIESLNMWLPGGKVLDAYFVRFIFK
ncbi:MAG: flagellar basal body-associated FliL family protein [Bdellovibrionia bacterium]